jgi:hypothetical protein
MKIAVLIVGEYRTFPYCRKTMKFLDQTPPEFDIDVYFHTWEITKLHNPPIGRELNPNTVRTFRPVSEYEIKDLLNRPAVIKVSPLPSENSSGFFIMRKGWLMGFDLIEQSGIEYDYVYVMRPDLFFRKEASYFTGITSASKYENAIGFLPQNEDGTIVADCDFFSTYKNIKKLMSEDVLLLDQSNEGIHRVWFEYVKSKNLNVTYLPFPVEEPHCIARFPMTKESTWKEVQNNYWNLFHNKVI